MVRRGLIERRRELDLTQEAIADRLGTDAGTVARWERGITTPRRRKAYADALDWTLAQLSHALRAGDDDAPLNGQAVPTWLSLHAALEQSASHIWAFQPFTVHALLQTPDYAAAVERADAIPKSEEGVARRVEVRLARQKVLDRTPDPLALSVLLDESVLLRAAGGPDVMTAQLDHLADAAERPNIQLRVLPLTAGRHSGAFGSFTVIATQGTTEAQIVCVENRTGMSYLEGAHPVDAHVEVWEHLWEHALPAEATADLIRRTAKEIDR